MAIVASGIGSGLDVSGIVGQLMALERRPIVALKQKEVAFNTELNSLTTLKSTISSFETAANTLSKAETFDKIKATSSNSDAFTATAETTAALTSYSIDVLSLAQADKQYATGAAAYSAETGAFDIASGDNTFSISIDGTNNSLEGIRDAINSATNNTSVTASIITDENDNQQLILTAKDIGSANAITLTDTSGNIAGVLGFSAVTGFEELDARVNVDGFIIRSSSNTITDAIDGVSLTLNSITDTAESLAISYDSESMTADINKFISLYNSLSQALDSFGGESGALNGDSALLSIERGVQRALNTASSNGTFQYLSDIGITTQEDGTLKLDSTKLSEALSSDLSSVAELFSAEEQGIAVRLAKVLNGYVDSETGLIKNRENGINSSLEQLSRQEKSLEIRMESIEARLRKQFTTLDILVSEMTSTGNFLAQQLASLPGVARQ